MKNKEFEFFLNEDHIDFFDPNQKISDFEIDEISRSKIKLHPILIYIAKNHLTRKEFAMRCDITLDQLDKILDDLIPLEVIEKIEKTIGLQKGGLINKHTNTIFFD